MEMGEWLIGQTGGAGDQTRDLWVQGEWFIQYTTMAQLIYTLRRYSVSKYFGSIQYTGSVLLHETCTCQQLACYSSIDWDSSMPNNKMNFQFQGQTATVVCEFWLLHQCFIVSKFTGGFWRIEQIFCSVGVFSDISTVLPAKSDSDFMFCVQSYQGHIFDRSLVY